MDTAPSPILDGADLTNPSTGSSQGDDYGTQAKFDLDEPTADAYGLKDAEVGQTYTATVRFQVVDNPDSPTGKCFQIDDLSETTPVDSAAEPGTDPSDTDSPDSADDASLGDTSGGTSDNPSSDEPGSVDPQDKAEEDMLGFKRPKKKMPFPPIKGLRD